ncbi:MAG: 7-cyano-7-deazaguanine synthase QueC, partial [Muribaculaceae bacterium]|nr:7-cyano-7-deazaguanine synthase QueC [Muribaculaceae bacterium]
MTDKAVLILSGGMDSTTLLHDYKDRIAVAVNFNYGSNHNRMEAKYARLNCQQLGIELIEIDLAFIHNHFKSSLLEGADAVPNADYAEDNLKSTVVPFRNGIMLAIAAGIAESRNLSSVMMANHSGDHAIYPDCTPQFVNAMNLAIQAGTYGPVRLEAPYTGLSKTDIARRGLELGLDFSLTYSCYRGGEHHCGTCATCR